MSSDREEERENGGKGWAILTLSLSLANTHTHTHPLTHTLKFIRKKTPVAEANKLPILLTPALLHHDAEIKLSLCTHKHN